MMLLFFLLLGRTLDHAMRRKTRAVAGNLAALKADTARRFMGDELVSVPVAALRPDDRVLVRPGERVPADGTVVSGASEIDDSLITGETMRRQVGANAKVYAGSLNYSGALTLRVTAAGQDSLIDEIERLLEKAASAKSRTRRLADRAARVYAPMVHLTSALTGIGWWLAGASLHDAVVTAIAVLIITCPCALSLAIPAVQVVASGALFRSNVILNAGDAIERLAEADTIVFDKTGTLTLPEPRVTNAAEIDPALLQAAARLALSSRHPLAMALAREADSATPFEGAVEEPGQGVRAVVDGVEARLGSADFCGLPPVAALRSDTSLIMFSHGGRSAAFAVSQQLRPDAVEVTKALAAPRLRLAHPVRRPQRCGGAGGARARHRALAGRTDAGREDRLYRDAEGGRPQGADGRRRPQRRAVAGCRPRLAVADRRRRPDAGAGRRGVPRRAAGAGGGGAEGGAARPRADDAEPGAGGGL